MIKCKAMKFDWKKKFYLRKRLVKPSLIFKPAVIVLLAGLFFSTWFSLIRVKDGLKHNSMLISSINQDISNIQSKMQELENKQKRVVEKNDNEEGVKIHYIASKSTLETTTPKPKLKPEPKPEPEPTPEPEPEPTPDNDYTDTLYFRATTSF